MRSLIFFPDDGIKLFQHGFNGSINETLFCFYTASAGFDG
jgi:hypothetical protein